MGDLKSLKQSKMKLYNPTYNSKTNKIVAYLLPEPKRGILEGMASYSVKLDYYKDSRIEIEVDDELLTEISKFCYGTKARRHKINGNVQFILWKKGEQAYKEDYWHNFDKSWWSEFKSK